MFASALRAFAQAYNKAFARDSAESQLKVELPKTKLAGDPVCLRIFACKRTTVSGTFASFVEDRLSRTQRAGGLGNLGRDEIHQGRRKAIVRLELQLSQPRPDRTHVVGTCARLDDRRDECREFRRRPARLVRAL